MTRLSHLNTQRNCQVIPPWPGFSALSDPLQRTTKKGVKSRNRNIATSLHIMNMFFHWSGSSPARITKGRDVIKGRSVTIDASQPVVYLRSSERVWWRSDGCGTAWRPTVRSISCGNQWHILTLLHKSTTSCESPVQFQRSVFASSATTSELEPERASEK